jgi:predicted nucleic acid-binding protein
MRPILAHTSIWLARRTSSAVAERLVHRYRLGAVVTCVLVELEVLALTQDAAALAAERAIVWRPLPRLPLDSAVCDRALEMQAIVARAGSDAYRLQPIDFLVAACAELGGAILWHCDPHLDTICEATGQPAERDDVPEPLVAV